MIPRRDVDGKRGKPGKRVLEKFCGVRSEVLLLVEVAATEERIGVHPTCQVDDAHQGVAKRLSTFPGCPSCCAGPSE